MKVIAYDTASGCYVIAERSNGGAIKPEDRLGFYADFEEALAAFEKAKQSEESDAQNGAGETDA
jgi:hypothetical protein